MNILNEVKNGLSKAFPQVAYKVLEEVMHIPFDAYNSQRKQFYSSRILAKINDFGKKHELGHVLGITDVDLFVPRLNFIFGEAEYGGRTAIISLFRLRPEFHNEKPDENLFVERSIKEAIHEVGHMLALGHCNNPACVMFFSNSVFDTDKKGTVPCEKCKLLVMNRLSED